MTEYELTENHARQIHAELGMAIEREHWQSVSDLCVDLKLLAQKQVLDHIAPPSRHGKRDDRS